MSVSISEWSVKVEAWRRSGLSIAAWCRVNAEGYNRFLYWRKQLESPQNLTPGKFIELSAPSVPIFLECNGVHIHVSTGFDPGLLEDILSLLKRG